MAETEDTVCISAVKRRNLEKLIEMIRTAVCARRVDFNWKLPYAKAGLLSKLYDTARVDSEEHEADSIRVKGSCDQKLYGQICKLLGVNE